MQRSPRSGELSQCSGCLALFKNPLGEAGLIRSRTTSFNHFALKISRTCNSEKFAANHAIDITSSAMKLAHARQSKSQDSMEVSRVAAREYKQSDLGYIVPKRRISSAGAVY